MTKSTNLQAFQSPTNLTNEGLVQTSIHGLMWISC